MLHQYNIPAKIRLVGTPDEEQYGGKIRMDGKGAFDEGDVWLMAHPTVTNAVQVISTVVANFPSSEQINVVFSPTNHW